MQNNNLNNYIQANEIDIKRLYKLLINSKKFIIAITLIITIIGVINVSQKGTIYHSTALIEIGNYGNTDILVNRSVLESSGRAVAYTQRQNEQILIESAKNLVRDLTINFNYKQQKGLLIDFFENRMINISHTSSSSVKSENLLNEIIRYIENRHSILLSNNTKQIKNQLTNKIESLNDQIEFIYNALLTKNKVDKIFISNEIKGLNNELPILDKKIESLNEIIFSDQKNLLLLKSNPELFIHRASQSPTLDQVIFSYKTELIDYENQKIKLSQKKDALKVKLQSLESSVLESEKIFQLSQQKDSLELDIEYLALTQQNETNTHLIREIETTAIESKKRLTILLSFIFGLILSIFMVFIYNSFKALNEE